MASGMLPSGGVVHADAHRTGRFRDECIDSCAGNLQQVGANAFEHVTALIRGLHCGQAYFRQRENALQADEQQVADEVGADLLGPTTHEFLHKSSDTFADGSLDFASSSHRALDSLGRERPAAEIPNMFFASRPRRDTRRGWDHLRGIFPRS